MKDTTVESNKLAKHDGVDLNDIEGSRKSVMERLFFYSRDELETLATDLLLEHYRLADGLERAYSLIARMQETNEKASEVWEKALKVWRMPYHERVRMAVRESSDESVERLKMTLRPTFEFRDEKDLEAHFYRHLGTYLPGAKRVDVAILTGNVPDGFIEIDGAHRPVECKLDCFDARALAQLQRYIEAYGMSAGVAVARRLAVRLPENIKFVDLSCPVDETDEYKQARIDEADRNTESLLVAFGADPARFAKNN